MGILALLLVLLVAFAALWLLAPRLRLPRPRLSGPAIALGAGLVFAPLTNLAIAGQFTFTPGGTNFFFGRLVQDGIVARYLADRCPDATLRLCAYRDQMPTNADGWLWGYDSPLHKLGWWQGFEPEARRIIGETLIRYPAAHVPTAAWAMLTQLVTLRSGDGMGAGDNWHAEGIFERYAPELLPRVSRRRGSRTMRPISALAELAACADRVSGDGGRCRCSSFWAERPCVAAGCRARTDGHDRATCQCGDQRRILQS